MAKIGRQSFHDKFDEETLLKLRIFQQYIKEWLRVFTSRRSYPKVNIFDFFSGPGSDACGNNGSPLIVAAEVSDYYKSKPIDYRIELTLYFNDKQPEYTKELHFKIERIQADLPCKWTIDNLDFHEAFKKCLPSLQDTASANLVLLDQFGFKHMPADIFKSIVSCDTTDLICFITSSYVKRFAKEKSTQKYVPVPVGEISDIPSGEIHRYICEYYRSIVPKDREYYIAPFSIKSQGNVYGLIFGSGKLIGLEKFLDVCWRFDRFTGEANYAIDNDKLLVSGGQLSFDDDENIARKYREFKTNLVKFLAEQIRTNHDIYRFTLENGFLPGHVNNLLRQMQETGIIYVKSIASGTSARKGSFYIAWKEYNKNSPKVRIYCKGKM